MAVPLFSQFMDEFNFSLTPKVQQPTLPVSDSVKVRTGMSAAQLPPNGDEVSSPDPVVINNLTDNKHAVVNKPLEKKRRVNTMLVVGLVVAGIFLLKKG